MHRAAQHDQVAQIPRRYRLIGFISDYASARGIADALRAPEPLSEVVYSFLHVQPDGEVYPGAQDPAVQWLRARRTRVLAGVTNQAEAVYSSEAADAALLAADSRSRLSSLIVSTVSSSCLDGAHLDFGRINCEHWKAMAQLASHARAEFARLSPNYTLSATVPHNWSAASLDLESMAANVDLMILEGIERGAGDPQGPLTSLAWLKENVVSALQIVGPSKLATAIGVYGLDWAEGNEVAFITSDAAARTANETGSRIIRDTDNSAAKFEYRDSRGQLHTVWYEDFISFSAKIRLLESLGVTKIALWRLGAVPADILEAASGARAWE